MAIRKPVVGVARPGSAGWAREARRPQAVSRYEPPRTWTQPSPASASTHSHTLPASCSAPVALAPAGCAVTGTVQPQPDSALLQTSGEKTSPQGHGRASSPRAAASHSSPVGSRTRRPSPAAAQAQNARASS